MTRHSASPIQRLAAYAQRLQYADLPAEVVQQAKKVTLDTLGVLLAAASLGYRATAAIRELVRGLGGTPEATVVGSGVRVPAVHAALANGTLADNIELDDSHPLSGAHIAAVIIPTALAVAEREGASGREFLTAVVLGYDVDARVVLGLNPASLYRRGFHPSAVGGCFGATATAGKLLGLTEGELIHALGLAGSQASGLMAWETDPTQMPKSLQMGIAARNGITAALLAQRGFSGPPDILAGRYNALAAFSDAPRPEALADELGTRFEIALTGLKKYACCRFLHATLDAFLDVVRSHDLGPADIESVTVRVPEAGAPIIDNNELLSHNAQYIIALAARDRQIMPHHIYGDLRSDPQVAALSQRVRVVGDPELSRVFPGRFSEPAVVDVLTRSGVRLTARSDYASGDPEKPLTSQEVEDKFMALAVTMVTEARAREIARLVGGLEALADMRVLGEMLGG